MVGERPIPKRIAAIVGSNGKLKTQFYSWVHYMGLQRHVSRFFAHVGI
jgi:hypothetical protein